MYYQIIFSFFLKLFDFLRMLKFEVFYCPFQGFLGFYLLSEFGLKHFNLFFMFKKILEDFILVFLVI